ncbi:MAG: UDP-N-acetylmuramoyl-tripeptide--D-alanyl-D-alanine ligase [Aerococcaceae bacterium]|nr:UDP-N-acetylmuramoyl-tripeptide--D-alanyl-D-alanine ligase [Aerococcaceae bacterium]
MKALSLMEIVKAAYAIDYTAKDRTILIENVEFDSRKVTKGSLFVPLVGGTTDGHDYIEQAIANGAVATLWSKAAETAPSDQIATVFVDDTLESFQKIAHYYRNVINPVVIGITGSNGKTTTKDMTATTLTAKYRVHKTEGNYNNEIGLPYTLLKMPEDTQVCVCEMGMSGFDEIRLLSEIAQPDIAAITLIGESHLEHLGSRAGIAKAKLEILYGLKENGIFIFPGNEPLIEQEMPEIERAIYMRSFGFDETSDVYAYDLVEEQNQTFFKTNVDANVTCMIPVLGAYNVSNALIALSIAEVLDVPMEQAIFKLSQFQLTANRLEWLKMPNGADVLNDAYNASPTSMKAVLATLSNLQTASRKIAVLGDIRELGETSAALHAELAQSLQPEQIERVYLFGEEMSVLYEALLQKYDATQLFYEATEHDVLIQALQQDIQPTDMVLVKSSFGTDLLRVVKVLVTQ